METNKTFQPCLTEKDSPGGSDTTTLMPSSFSVAEGYLGILGVGKASVIYEN